MSNVVPPLIEQSLQYFLTELIQKSEDVANEHGLAKLTPAALKQALLSLDPGYDFMKDAMDDVEDVILPPTMRTKSSQRNPKRSKSDADKKEDEKQKRGRKKVKIDEEGEN